MDENSLFPDLALADAQLDVSSWLLQDDLYQQGFCDGAREVHSLSSMAAGYSSPPFITSQDLPDWMEASDDIDWDQPFNFENCFHKDIKKLQQVQPSIEKVPTELISSDIFSHYKSVQESKTKKEQVHQSQKEELLQQTEFNEVLYQESAFASPQPYPEYISSSLDQFDLVEEVVTTEPKADPCIISVPLTDAFNNQKPVFKTINISSIHVVGSEQKLNLQAKGQQRNPQKIVINLRRVSLPAKNVVKTEKVEVAPEPVGPTLKEVLTSGDADAFIRELVSLPPKISDKIQEAKNEPKLDDMAYENHSPQNYSVLSFEDHTNDELMFSPASSSGYSSSDQFPESPEDLSEEYSPAQPSVRSTRYSPFSTVEKQQRKKEQNKRAALRYRQKRKEEDESIMTVLNREEEKQKILQEQYNSLNLEVKLMKKLMREMLIKKKINKKE